MIIKKLKIVLLFVTFLTGGFAYGQSTHLERQVIGSTGNFSTGSNLHLSATAGEPITTTGTSANYVLTQGFHQPRAIILDPLTAIASATNSSCDGAADGSVKVDSISGCLAPYSIRWNTPDEDTTAEVTGLAAGEYVVTVTGATNCTFTDTVVVGLDSETSCELHIYSGITPNSDGNNDKWVIDNIDLDNYQPNKVSIFNRWGDQVWTADNYNNTEVYWQGQNQVGQPLPDGTYYYVVNIEGGETYKGWVEITR